MYQVNKVRYVFDLSEPVFYVVYQDNKLEDDLEKVTNKVYFDIEIDGKHIGMLYCSLCVCVCVCVSVCDHGYALFISSVLYGSHLYKHTQNVVFVIRSKTFFFQYHRIGIANCIRICTTIYVNFLAF